MYRTPLQIGDREVRVGLHTSIVEMLARPEIATDVIACLLTFSDKLAASVWLKQATEVTYLKVEPFEYYPVLVIDGLGHRRYFAHGGYTGWWQIEKDEVWFAGSREPEEGETGTVATGTGVEVPVHTNAIELIEKTLAKGDDDDAEYGGPSSDTRWEEGR